MRAERHLRLRIKAACLRPLSALCRRRHDRLPPGAEPRRILVYGMMGIGNMLLFTPALRAIRQRFPRARIVILASAGPRRLLEGTELADEVWDLPSGRAALLRTVLRIRRTRFDLLVSTFHGSDHPTLTVLGGIPQRAGHVSSPGWTSPFDRLVDLPVRMEEDQHEVDRGLALAHALGADTADTRPRLEPGDDARRRALMFLQEAGVPENARLVGVQADCWRGHPWKRWSPERLARVCDVLAERGDTIVVQGAPHHREEGEELIAKMRSSPIIEMGSLDLRASAALLERCRLTITNDSGLMHLSAAVGTPVVAVYGPTDPRRTSPHVYGVPHVLVRRDEPCSPCFRMEGDAQARACRHHRCLAEISVEDVLRAVDRLETACCTG